MDVPTRLRIVVGLAAIVFALVASMALLNLLVLEPGSNEGDQGGGGQNGAVFQPQPGEPTQEPTEGDGNETGQGQEGSGKKNPCKTGRSVTQAAAITTMAMALLLWLLGVWWRQQRQTRVMNGWSIAGLVFTLMAVTLFFAWYIIDQICSLRVTDLDTCRDIARNLLVTFIAFLIPALGFLGYAIKRKREGHAFMGLWSGAGFVFLYLTVMALGGHIVADNICDRYFQPDLDDFDPNADPDDDPDPGSTGQPTTGGSPPSGSNPPSSGNPNNPGSGSNNGNQNAGGGGPSLVGVPQISPVFLLVLMGIAAIVVIVVLAVRGGGKQFAGGLGAQDDVIVVEDRASLLALMNRTELESHDRVVAGYRAFLAFCTVRGIGKAPFETPYEHARRAIKELHLPQNETLDLATAYQQTRLGNTPTPKGLRERVLAFTKHMGGR